MRLAKPRGLLFIIGGGEDKDGDCTILREFVRLAGDDRARIVVMTAATDEPVAAGAEYVRVFTRLGAKRVDVVDVSTRQDASDEESLAVLEQATGIFFTGGDQLHVTSLIGGSEMDMLLHELYKKGVVIAGTSAGAAMMSGSMFVRGPAEENPRLENLQLGPGAEFLMGAVIDTHFSQRGRHGRLISAVAHYPHALGVGIDEDTALVAKDGIFEVIGRGAVTIIDAGELTYTNVPDLKEDEGLALYNIKLHVLTAGHRYNMHERQPIIEEHSRREIGSARVRRTGKPRTPSATKKSSKKTGKKSTKKNSGKRSHAATAGGD
ncbi:MAG TPA: cyanophycinase [Pyrinomonadaceae bacterium]|jgi:cyanophycinase